MTTTTPEAPDTAATEAFVERLFGAVLATMDLHAVYLGDRLGYYRALDRRAADLGGAGRPHRHRRALRPGVAGAAGRHRHPRHRPGGRRGAPPLHPARGARRAADRRARPRPRRTVRAGDDRVRQAGRPPGRGLPHRRRGELGAARRGRPRGPGRRQPAAVPRPAGPRVPAVDPGRRRRPAGRRAGWPTWAAGWAGRRSASRWPTRTPRWTATTSTARRSRPRAATPARPGSTTACGSTPWTPAPCDGATYDAVFAFECVHDLPDPVAVLAAMRRLAGRRRGGGGDGRAGGRDVHGPRRRGGAADVRLQPDVLPGRRDGAPAVGRRPAP